MAITNGQTADADDINAELSALASDISALDSAAVKLTGNQTLQGVKTFGSIPVLPASNPTTDNQAVRKAYVDNVSFITFVASANIRNYNDTAAWTYTDGYVKLKETRIDALPLGKTSMTIRVYCTATKESGGVGLYRLYKNGSAIGAAHSQAAGSGTIYYDDISVAVGDLIQGYGNNQSVNYRFGLSNFRLAYDEAISKINNWTLLTPLNITEIDKITVTNNA